MGSKSPALKSPAIRDYWGYLIEPDKTPTPLLEQLLLGIAHYINKNIAPWKVNVLSPPKLAAYYRLLGGNYDLIFIGTPPASLGFIYESLGCYHSLQPVQDPFAKPRIPALTPEGFVRWQTIQLLLDPAAHVPILQAAVKRLDITNPVGGTPFPRILPAEALPSRPDPGMTRWHDQVTEREFGTVRDIRIERTLRKPSEGTSSSSSSSNNSPEQSRNRSRPVPPPQHRRSRSKTSHSPRATRKFDDDVRSSKQPQSHPGHESTSPRDGPTPTIPSHHSNKKPASPSHHRRKRTPSPLPTMLSITDGSETQTDEESSTRSASPKSSRTPERHSFHEGPRPYYDKYGRRHSAHSPYDERDHVPRPPPPNQNTLSPPFFAAAHGFRRDGGGGHKSGHREGESRRWRQGMEAYDAAEAGIAGAGPSTPTFSQRESYFDDRPRRQPAEPAGGGGNEGRGFEGGGWR